MSQIEITKPEGSRPTPPLTPPAAPERARAQDKSIPEGPSDIGPSFGARPSDGGVSRIGEAYEKVIEKLFRNRDDGKPRCLYRAELEAASKEKGCAPEVLLERAIMEVLSNSGPLEGTARLTAKTATQVGDNFAAVAKILTDNMDIFVAGNASQLADSRLPITGGDKRLLETVVDAGQAAAIILVKNPPDEAAREIRKVSDEKLAGLMSLWSDERVREKLTLSPELKDFLSYATVRVLCTGKNKTATEASRALNQSLERTGGFEDKHWVRVVKQVSQSEQHESLSATLKVCAPILIAVKLTEKFMPGAMHIIGGALDDLFGAVLPDVSQSMGRKDLPFMQRIKSASGVLMGGLASIPVSAGLGWGALSLYEHSTSLGGHMAAGAVFALACCAGTAATSAAAFWKAWRGVKHLEKSPEFGEIIKEKSEWEKIKLAVQSSILDVPFRLGHTIIGVPTQIGLGMAAGGLGFFHNGLFVAAEGMLETLLGATTAYVYPSWRQWHTERALRKNGSTS